MNIKPICTERDYQEALEVVSAMFDKQPEVNTPEFDRMKTLVLLIEAYETEHYPISSPHPIEAIKFRMEQMNLSAKDLLPVDLYHELIKARSRVQSFVYADAPQNILDDLDRGLDDILNSDQHV
ncbi:MULTISPECIES: type II toxin-antitoxin system HigA family antitoxin [unclassified Bartonella]|uniref:helix-turn-helix domain-containing protein n=1 Tax=unclassified Bartonella TaxID=2645622 RepID=UPI0035D0A5D7